MQGVSKQCWVDVICMLHEFYLQGFRLGTSTADAEDVLHHLG